MQSQHPDSPQIHKEIIQYYLEQNKPEEIEKILNRLLRDKEVPLFVTDLYNAIGSWYRESGEYEKSGEMFNKASELREIFYKGETEKNYRKLAL